MLCDIVGMHVMSQLAQLADLRDLLLTRQPSAVVYRQTMDDMDAMDSVEFEGEDEIEEWYVNVSQ